MLTTKLSRLWPRLATSTMSETSTLAGLSSPANSEHEVLSKWSFSSCAEAPAGVSRRWRVLFLAAISETPPSTETKAAISSHQAAASANLALTSCVLPLDLLVSSSWICSINGKVSSNLALVAR